MSIDLWLASSVSPEFQWWDDLINAERRYGRVTLMYLSSFEYPCIKATVFKDGSTRDWLVWQIGLDGVE